MAELRAQEEWEAEQDALEMGLQELEEREELRKRQAELEETLRVWRT